MEGLELKVLVGSQAYGIAGPDSDHDYAGFFCHPTEELWRVDVAAPETRQFSKDFTVHEVGKLFRLLASGNPTANETLWAPVVESTPIGELVRGIRTAFLSRRAIGAYFGYAHQQRHKIDLRVMSGETMDANHHARSWKNAAHVLRLCIAGRVLLESGEVMVHVGDHAPKIIAIRRGEVAAAEALRLLDEELAALESATGTTKLPEQPDWATINRVLQDIRCAKLGRLVAAEARVAGKDADISNLVELLDWGTEHSKSMEKRRMAAFESLRNTIEGYKAKLAESDKVLKAVGDWVEQLQSAQVLLNDGVHPSEAMLAELDRRAIAMADAFNAAKKGKSA